MSQSPRRVVVLGSYPVKQPRHGGQLRLTEIIAAYRESGYSVVSVNCFPASAFYLQGGCGGNDFPAPLHELGQYRGFRAPFIEDLACGDWIVSRPGYLRRIRELVGGGCAAIHLEQPWLLPLARELLQHLPSGIALIYGSQNIESPLKEAIFDQYKFSGAEPLIRSIDDLERQAAALADIVLAVTSQDAAKLAGWIKPKGRVVLAGNGIRPWQASAQAIERWRARLGERPFGLYAASGHPPNVKGFVESFWPSLAALAPDQRIVVAGGVADQLGQHPWFGRWGPLHARRLELLGVLAQTDLDALRVLAHSFVLPTTSGGGSHLKTAEALYSGRHVIATPLAMRGFESFLQLTGLQVVSPGLEFARAVGQSLRKKPLELGDRSCSERNQLTWSSTLAPMIKALAEHEACR